MAKAKSKTENRYPGVDTVPWKIVNAQGKNPLTSKTGVGETFPGYNAANLAAKRFTQETGEWTSAARV